MNKYMIEAQKIKDSIQGLGAIATNEAIVEYRYAFPFWNGNEVSYKTNDILQYDNDVYRVLQNHTSQSDWTPDVAVSLYVKISLEEWAEWVQPVGAHDAYSLNAQCSHNGKHWISDYDNNIWEPGAFGWHEVE